jgi:hypothetical protein
MWKPCSSWREFASFISQCSIRRRRCASERRANQENFPLPVPREPKAHLHLQLEARERDILSTSRAAMLASIRRFHSSSESSSGSPKPLNYCLPVALSLQTGTRVLERIGNLAYRLDIPPNWKIHPVISVAHLEPKPFVTLFVNEIDVVS